MMISQDTYKADQRKAQWTQARFGARKSLDDLGHQIIELAGHLNSAHYRFLKLIAEWDQRKGWGGEGATQSCAHWLNWKCGIDIGAAREKIRTANALLDLPQISAAMERGELSYAKVRALTRVACPSIEQTLLEYALHGTAAHVERIVRDFRRCKEAEELSRDAQQQANLVPRCRRHARNQSTPPARSWSDVYQSDRSSPRRNSRRGSFCGNAECKIPPPTFGSKSRCPGDDRGNFPRAGSRRSERWRPQSDRRPCRRRNTSRQHRRPLQLRTRPQRFCRNVSPSLL
jgi:hypothetical protein